MKNRDTFPKRRPGFLLAALCLITVFAAAPAAAAYKYWVDGSSWWDYSSNWSLSQGGPGGAGQPQDGDLVGLYQSDATNRTVYYRNTAYPSAVLQGLYIDATGSGLMTLNQGYGGYGHPLSAVSETIGDSGKGAYIQSAGSNTVTGLLAIGGDKNSQGTYDLSGGTLSAYDLYMGVMGGTGTFTQSGNSSNTVSNSLNLGVSALYGSGESVYILNGGALKANSEVIGDQSIGTFDHSAGSNTVTGYLTLGNARGQYGSRYYTSDGWYKLSGTGRLSAAGETIGGQGYGLFTQTGGSNEVSGNLTLAASSTCPAKYDISNGTLTAGSITVNDKGTFQQTGGSTMVSGTIMVNSGGAFSMSGASTLKGTLENHGIFNYSGGTFSGRLLAYAAPTFNADFTAGDGMANYTYITINAGRVVTLKGQGLDNQGILTVNGSLGGSSLLNNTNGNLTLNSGSSITSDLTNRGFLTYNGGTFSNRLYNYASEILLTFNADFTAGNGMANYGTVPVPAGVTFTLNGEGLDNQGRLTVNGSLGGSSLLNNTTGKLTQDGGSITSDLTNLGSYLYYGGIFAGRLLAYAAPTFNADFTAGNGMANYTALTIATGRAIALNGQGLDNQDTLILGGGTLRGSGPLVNNASMSGYGTISGSGSFINNAFFTQNGGNFTLSNTGHNLNYGNFDLAASKLFTLGSGATLDNQGTLNLNQASVTGAGGILNNYGGVIAGKGTIASNFANAGGSLLVEAGTTNITKAFSNSGLVQLSGATASLVGGAVINTGTIQGCGSVGNNVSNTGIVEALGGTLTLGGAVANHAGGLIAVSTNNKLLVANGLGTNDGVINLTGGTFDNNNRPLSNSTTGQMSGYGTFRTGGLTNSGNMTLSGGTTAVTGNVTNQNGGRITVAYTPAIFTGDVTNYGTVKTTGTTVTWAGSFTNNGGYISDPATQTFTDLTVGSGGYLQAALGDTFIITGNFDNQSTQNTSWNTRAALLKFATGTTNFHEFKISGGLVNSIYAFSWGTLDITGQELDLMGSNLYVGGLLGVTHQGNMITNIQLKNPLDIFYDPTLPENAYLDDMVYQLEGGGVLQPTPLPTSAWLFLSGLAGLGILGMGRRAKKS